MCKDNLTVINGQNIFLLLAPDTTGILEKFILLYSLI